MKLRYPWLWVPSLYTAEGIPYVIVMSVATIMYGRLGLTNAQIALYTSWLYLPWVIKPFWSPVVEMFGSKRRWIVAMQFLIGTSMAGVAFFLPGSHFVQSTLAFFWLMAFSSATHDIAADGFYLLALDTRDQAFFVGIRSTFYRIASILGQGFLVMLAGTLEARFQPVRAWMLTFIFISVVFLLFAFWHARVLPRHRFDAERKVVSVRQAVRDFLSTFVSFFRKPAVIPALLFMLLYRLPEALLVKICPLFMLDSPDHGGLGLTTGDLGMVNGTIGVVGLTLGGILGGVAAERGGLRRWLWPMVLAITLPDVVYIFLSYYQPESLVWIGACVFVEQFGYGFGFTAYMLYLMLYARGANSTAHYSFCTGLMALGMMLPGFFAGYLQELVGYLNFFIIVTVLCLFTFGVSALVMLDKNLESEDVEE
ncbi:MAG: MFS transporter [Alloprevotella sp.]